MPMRPLTMPMRPLTMLMRPLTMLMCPLTMPMCPLTMPMCPLTISMRPLTIDIGVKTNVETLHVMSLLLPQVREAEPQSGAFPVEDWKRDERGNVSKHFCLVTFTLS